MLNPLYDKQMRTRQDAQAYNLGAAGIGRPIAVPKQPNRYVPHYGAKEAAKYANLALHRLGSNGSNVLSPDHNERVGQTVTWTSSNLTKRGVIIAVVPAGERPKNDFTPKVDVSGSPRDHISYVVRAKGKHYWPRVSLLNLGGV